MKNFILGVTISTLIFFSVFLSEKYHETEYAVYTIILSDFCSGWEDGYCEGYRTEKGRQTVCPVSPVCPVAEADGDTYSRGFSRGYEKGREDANGVR